jgi:hypothetical protein
VNSPNSGLNENTIASSSSKFYVKKSFKITLPEKKDPFCRLHYHSSCHYFHFENRGTLTVVREKVV